jgi:ABC-2 type transport system ATP-binding protein
MPDAVIAARGVGKRFLIHHQRATSLKERLLQTRRSQAEEFWALRDIELDINGGETVGLIGANGSGKSTLLKLLAGILEPTAGTVRVRGRVASLLELGAGFNGELTGRENIYLNASILGLSRREINRNYDSIVEFSGLEQFIDNQVKHYSSGQYVRLGFAIAVHVDPDILLVDEVLAVGDEAFQAKCLAKIAEFQERGCTILFVTHALDLVPRLCSRGLVLDHGRVLHDGDALEAAERLRVLLGTAADQSGGAAAGSSGLRITGLRLVDPGAPTTHKGEFRVGEPMNVEVDVTAGAEPPPAAALRVAVTGPADVPMWVMDTEGERFEPNASRTIRFIVKELPPIQGIFALAIALREPGGRALDARRYSEAIRMVGASEHALVDVAWTIDGTEEEEEEEEEERAKPSASRRPRAAGDRRRR